MSDQPGMKNRLVYRSSDDYDRPSQGNLMIMASDDILHKTLEELLRCWTATMSPIDIGSDPVKVRLLKEISEKTGGTPSTFVRSIYDEVFLRDVWTRPSPGDDSQG